MSNLHLQLLGHRMTTAEIIYRMPDHPSLLQTYVWQNLDTAPRFPKLRRFLSFWEANLDGALHLVRVASAPLVQPAEFRFVDGDLILH
jgi:uncharacterized protein Usg